MTGVVVRPDGTRRLVVAALGTTVTIVFAPTVTDEVVAAAAHSWSDAAPPADSADETGPIVEVAAAPIDATLSDLSMHVTLAALDHVRGTSLLFHACGLALPDGRVVALVGPSGRGKTTAARRMGAVFGYVSDESVAVRDDGAVLEYRKPLSVIENGMPVKRQLPPSQAGLQPLPEAPLRLAALALLDRRTAPGPDDAPGASIDEVSLTDAVVALVPQMSYLTSMDRPLQTLAHAIDRVGGVARVTYTEADELSGAIAALAERSAVAPSWRVGVGVAAPVPPGLIGRAEVTDAIELDDGTVIALSGDTVRVLDGIAPALWRAAATPRTIGQLVEAVVAEHGSPAGADAAELVGRAVDELVTAEVLDAP